jgi:uncharacterized protein with NAD-binding domain and iron-sulfur cluster
MVESPNTPSGQPVAWIFGAGITGLTAAHELIERGFEVYVVEPADDPWEPDLPAVGGVARTQWAMIPPAPADGVEGLTETVPMLRHPVLDFDGELGAAALGPDHRWELDAFARKLRAVYGDALPTVRIQVCGAHQSTARHLGDALDALLSALTEYAATQGVKLVRDATLDVHERDTQHIRVVLVLEGRGVVPGEHGFRYFPGFYRHLFDTMRRTAVLSTGEDRYGPVVRSVFDNLVGTEATWLHLPPAGPSKDEAPDEGTKSTEHAEGAQPGGRLIRFPRRPPRSPQALLAALRSFVHELGYEPGDLAHLSLKLFQYMTSCKARRAAEHEDMTWWEFLQGEKFSLRCRAHMERGPEVLGAMTATESDVRTQGNMVTQLLIDQLVGRTVTDATLNGPTSLAWFDHWREYLVFRGVKFFRGMLVDFDLPDEDNPDHRRDVLLPRVAIAHHTLDPRSFTTAVRPHYFVLAAPVTAMMGRGEFVRANPELDPREDTFGVPGTNLAARFLARHTTLRARLGDTMEPAAAAVDDFVALQRWEAAIAAEEAREPNPARGAGPLRHLCGVQFFFPANVQFGQEHTLYMESGWRLSSISQVHFWHRRPTGTDGYRGIVSVDLGAMHRPLGRDIPGREGAPPHTTHAWNLPRAIIAEEVFRDVADSIAVNTLAQRRAAAHHPPELFTEAFNPAVQGLPHTSVPVPRGRTRRSRAQSQVALRGAFAALHTPLEPLCYHFDQNVTFAPDGKGVAQNLSPYLINRPREWARRPGTPPPAGDTQRGYALQNARWVLAGTYMKTHTRLTTMEAANESARHAVNAILHDQQSLGDRCMIWDPEDFELAEFDDLKALDSRLFRDGYPHMVEILGLDEIPWALVPGFNAFATESDR